MEISKYEMLSLWKFKEHDVSCKFIIDIILKANSKIDNWLGK